MSVSERLNNDRCDQMRRSIRDNGPMTRAELEAYLGLTLNQVRETLTFARQTGQLAFICRGGGRDVWCLPKDAEQLREETQAEYKERKLAAQARKRARERGLAQEPAERDESWFEAQPVNRTVTDWKAPSRIPVNSVFALAEEA